MNKRLPLFLLTTILFTAFASAQDAQTIKKEKNKFAIKVQPFTGTYLDQNHHFDKFREKGSFVPTGINLGLEFPSMQQRPWQQYLNNSTFGVGMSLIDFGNDIVGKSVAVYPYLLIPAIRSKHFELDFKVAAGLGLVTEHWYTGNVSPDNYDYSSPDVSTIFGCYLNAYLNAGINVNIPINRNVALNSEFGYFHMSNGRTCMPNVGLNAIYGGVGVIKTFNANAEKSPIQFPDLPYKWSLNITGAAGAHRAWMYYPLYLISSFHTGAVYNVTNWYAVGMGVDAFYNGAIDKGTGRSLYCQDREYTTADKIRVGIALNNEFQFGLVTAIVDWGVYLYNPSRNYYYDSHVEYGHDHKHPLFYKSMGAGSEEAFHYFRFGLKTRIWDNFYLQTTAKTHLYIAEYVEFGIGYQIPFLKKDKRSKGKSIIHHHNKNWWK